jgi:hypothetical protein
MDKKVYKYSVVHKVWNAWQSLFEIQTATLTVFRELNTKMEISQVMSVGADTIISFEAISQ